MKKIKTIISLILVSIGLMFIGEFSLGYIDNFANDIPNTTIIYQPGMEHKDMKDDVLDSAERNNVDFFVIKNDLISINRKNIIIYQSNSGVKDWISENKNIVEKNYKSLFMGHTKVSFEDYNNINDADLKVNNNYYLIGDADDIKNFKMELIDKYAGNHPLFPEKQTEYIYTTVCLWTIIFGLCLVFTKMYAQYKKKEVFIKVIYGENRLVIFIVEAMSDLFFIYGGAILIQKLLLSYTDSEFYINIFYLLSGIFATLNTLVYLSFFQYKIQKIYNDKRSAESSIFLLYVLRFLSIIMVSLILTANLVMIKEALSFISQEEFFKKYKEYYYTNIGYIPRENFYGQPETDIEDNALIKEIFYRKHYKEFEPIVLVNLGETNKKEDIILANRNSLEYIESKFDLLKTITLEDKCYYFIPETTKNNKEKEQVLDLKLQNYIGADEIKNREVIYYKESVSIINIDGLFPLNSKTSRNPVIILDNTVPSFNEEKIKGNPFITTYDMDIMYRIDDSMFEKFISEYNLTSEINSKSNVYEVYMNGKLMMQRVLKMSLVISIILIFFEITVLLTLIKLEFRLNAYKISIKKILGYNMFERYSKLSLLSLIGSVTALTMFVAVELYFRLFPILYGSAVIVIIYLVEKIFIGVEVDKLERRNIHLVLKGEFR